MLQTLIIVINLLIFIKTVIIHQALICSSYFTASALPVLIPVPVPHKLFLYNK